MFRYLVISCQLAVVCMLVGKPLELYASEFDMSQTSLAGQIISVFENNTPYLQYGYAEVLDDGRGITAGRAGFTTGTRDLLLVVEHYTLVEPENKLEPYLSRLRELGENWSGSTQGLDGLQQAWTEAASDPVFRQVQDDVVESMYLSRVRTIAAELGISSPLGMLILSDSILQHGFGPDPDSLPSMVKRTTRKVGDTPLESGGELVWLTEFLACRRVVLENANNSATRHVWAQSSGRINTLERLLAESQWGLDQTIQINPWGTAFTLPVDVDGQH